jgi:hypothetical protein
MGIVAIAISTPRASESLREGEERISAGPERPRQRQREPELVSCREHTASATAAGTPEFRNRTGVRGLDSRMLATCNDEAGYASRLQMPVATSNLNETIILTAATDKQDNDQQCGRLPVNRQETGHNI